MTFVAADLYNDDEVLHEPVIDDCKTMRKLEESKEFHTYKMFREAASFIQTKTKHNPEIGIILGSGLSPLAQEIEDVDSISYRDIPHFPCSSAPGHEGRLAIGKLAGKSVMAMDGRSHYYEGYSSQEITLPVRVMQVMGIQMMIVTNASGGINENFHVGDLMLIVDHINLVGLTGNSPLRGPNLMELGPRFPNMTEPYDSELQSLARTVANKNNIALQEGVYTYVAGPSYETPAEVRLLGLLGADAVGMSTVPEVVVASHNGMRVLGISTITNTAIKERGSDQETTHGAVLEAGQNAVPKLTKLLKGILESI